MIRAVDMQGVFQTGTDSAILRHSEDSKGTLAQANSLIQNGKDEQERSEMVIEAENVYYAKYDSEHKNGGNGQEAGQNASKRKKNDSESDGDDGKVLVKGMSRFDVRA